MKLKPIDQQVVVVMGAASGIGRVTAREFARRGASVVAADNDAEGLQTLVSEVQGQRGRIASVVADVTDFGQVQGVAEAAVQRFGHLDTWAHVAAVAVYATFDQTTLREFERVIDVNLMGQVRGAKAAIPQLRRNGGGAFISVSSIEAKRSLPLHSAYASSKHGVDGFLESLRLELRKEGAPISVTEILPSSINTPFFDKAETKMGVKPMGLPPLYEPITVAKAIVHAAEHPVRDIIVGGAGKVLVTSQRMSPRMVDQTLMLVGFRGQKTNEPRSADAPNSLFGPVGRYNRVEGDFGKLSFKHTASTWLDTHPAIKGALAVGAAFAIGRAVQGRGDAVQTQGENRVSISRTPVGSSRS